MSQKIDWCSDRKDNLSRVFTYVGYLDRMGFLRTLDFFLLNIREDADLTLMMGIIRITWKLHEDRKLKYWRQARNRAMGIYKENGYSDERIKKVFQGLIHR